MIFAKETTMKNEKNLKIEINRLKKQIQKTKEEGKKLDQANVNLQDEVDSLWAMLEEMTKTDVGTWSKITKDLKTDTVTKALMITGKKAEA